MQVGGGGSVAADAELDSLKDAVEREIVSGQQLIGQWGPLVQQLCHDRLAAPFFTQSSKHRSSSGFFTVLGGLTKGLQLPVNLHCVSSCTAFMLDSETVWHGCTSHCIQ